MDINKEIYQITLPFGGSHRSANGHVPHARAFLSVCVCVCVCMRACMRECVHFHVHCVIYIDHS